MLLRPFSLLTGGISINNFYFLGAGSSIPATGSDDFVQTDTTLALGGQIIYVAASGSDSNDGLTMGAAKLTPSGAKTALRNGSPDQMLLKRGDSFISNIGSFPYGSSSTTYPMIIGAWGSGARPKVLCGDNTGIAPSTIGNLALVGLELYGHTYSGTEGTYGVSIALNTSNITIEDCHIHNFHDGIRVADSISVTNLRVRRSLIEENFSTGATGYGINLITGSGTLLEGNTICKNGFYPGVVAEATTRYGVYVGGKCKTFSAIDNIFAYNSHMGIYTLADGTIKRNLFLKESYCIGQEGDATNNPNGTNTLIEDNVFQDGKNTGATAAGGIIELKNTSSCLINNNIGSLLGSGTGDARILFTYAGTGVGARNVRLVSNIFWIWPGRADFGAAVTANRSITLSANDFAHMVSSAASYILDHQSNAGTGVSSYNNKFVSLAATGSWFYANGAIGLDAWKALVGDTTSVTHTGQSEYTNPNRTISSYMSSIGETSSFDGFLTAARGNTLTNWNTQYGAKAVINYIREGFDLDPV